MRFLCTLDVLCSHLAWKLLMLPLVLMTACASHATPQKNKPSNHVAIAMNEADFDTNTSIANHYQCELNESFIVYTQQATPHRAALRWKNKLYPLTRVETTTGANRFENKAAGLVWIGIPTKAMLLDSIHGQQLANECRTTT